MTNATKFGKLPKSIHFPHYRARILVMWSEPFGTGHVSWVLAGVNAAEAALLLRAAAAKFVRPDVTAAALAEIWPGHRRPGSAAVRFLATTEVVAGVTTAIPFLRLPGQILIGLLSFSFIVIGAVGAIRGSSLPCGCFGAESARPLGGASILMGFGLMACAAVNLMAPHIDSANTLSAGTSAMAVIISAVWLLTTHRHRAVVMTRNLLNRSEHA